MLLRVPKELGASAVHQQSPGMGDVQFLWGANSQLFIGLDIYPSLYFCVHIFISFAKSLVRYENCTWTFYLVEFQSIDHHGLRLIHRPTIHI